MDDFEQVLLEAAKDAFEVLTEDGTSKEEALTTIKDMYDSPNRSAEFKQELEALKEEVDESDEACSTNPITLQSDTLDLVDVILSYQIVVAVVEYCCPVLLRKQHTIQIIVKHINLNRVR